MDHCSTLSGTPLNDSSVTDGNPETYLNYFKKNLSHQDIWPTKSIMFLTTDSSTMPPSVTSPLFLTHELSLSLLNTRAPHDWAAILCREYLLQPPCFYLPWQYFLKNLYLFIAGIQQQAVPACLRTPLPFCWQTSTHPILSGGSHCSHSQALGLFVLVKTNIPSKTQLLHNVLTYRIGVTLHAPNPFLRSRKHLQDSYCPWAHPRTLQPLPTSSGSPMARLLVTTWMSSREVS